MAERKFVRMWIPVFVAIVAVFAAGEARAASTCTPAGECANLDGYHVTVDRTGGFPSTDGGNSVFQWNFSGTPNAIGNVNTIDIKIPAEVDPSYETLRSRIEVSIIPTSGNSCNNLSPFTPKNPTGWVLAPRGLGDLTTSIGRFEYDYYVLTVVPPKSGSCAITKTTANTKIKLKFNGKSLKSGLNSFLVRASLLGEALNLLGPSTTGTSSSASETIRSFESFKLGDTGCKMDIDLEGGTKITKAVTRSGSNPVDVNDPCYKVLDIKPMRTRFVCEYDCNTGPCLPVKCLPKTSVERAIMEKSDYDSKYCYSSAGYSACSK